MRAIVAAAAADEREITVPTAVLAEAWRGGHAGWLARLLAVSRVEPLTESLARRAGELLARTGSSEVIDAITAVSAAQRGDVVVTSDPHDLQRLADELRTIRIMPV